MVDALSRKSPAPRANAKNRADFKFQLSTHSIDDHCAKPDFAANFIARRFGLAPSLATTIAGLAGLGGANG